MLIIRVQRVKSGLSYQAYKSKICKPAHTNSIAHMSINQAFLPVNHILCEYSYYFKGF